MERLSYLPKLKPLAHKRETPRRIILGHNANIADILYSSVVTQYCVSTTEIIKHNNMEK